VYRWASLRPERRGDERRASASEAAEDVAVAVAEAEASAEAGPLSYAQHFNATSWQFQIGGRRGRAQRTGGLHVINPPERAKNTANATNHTQ